MTGNDVEYTYGTSGNETGRFLLWTEDCYGCEHLLCLFNVVNNRMHAAVDEKYSSYYVHDHSGERRESRDQSQACLSYAETKQSVRSDHLGSASWITDNGGLAVQHLQYLPYGERYVDQRAVGYNERFTFTGKEKDSLRLNLQSGELCRARLTSPPDLFTSYYYFGARYMDHELMTMWLSVDPMSDKYPSISPYAYCAWNPVKLVDPDGMKFDSASLIIVSLFKENIDNRMRAIDITKSDRTELNDALSELKTLEESDQLYTIQNIGKNYDMVSGGTDFDIRNFSVLIEYDGDIGTLAHELKHASQYENKELFFGRYGNIGELYDIYDEIEAYKRGGVFDKKQKNMNYYKIQEVYRFKVANDQYEYCYPFINANDKKILHKNSIKIGHTKKRNLKWAIQNNISLEYDFYRK